MDLMTKRYKGSVYGSITGSHRNPKFTDVWDNVDSFYQDYTNSGIPANISEESARTVFYLLYSQYGNSTIAANDVTRFKYKLFSIIFSHGPTWEKRMEIQKRLRELTDEDISIGSVQIYNTAENPSAEPSTSATKTLDYINKQNVTHNIKGKLAAYATLDSILINDLTSDFLRKFKILFLTFVAPEEELTYIEGE